MKKKITSMALLVAAGIAACAGCGKNTLPADDSAITAVGTDVQTGDNESVPGFSADIIEDADISASETETAGLDDMIIRAMYIPLQNGLYVFVSEQSGAFIIASGSNEYEITDIDGNVVSMEQLDGGNIVDIVSNGIMMESYPGQLAGVTKMAVVDVGTEEDTAKYQDIIDELSPAGDDDSEVPDLVIEYITPMSITSVHATQGGYSWTVSDKDGVRTGVIADAPPILAIGYDLIDVPIPKGTDLSLIFSSMPDEVSVQKYDISAMGPVGSSDASFEDIEVVDEGGTFIIRNADTSGVYSIKAVWDKGTVEYGFYTKPMKTDE